MSDLDNFLKDTEQEQEVDILNQPLTDEESNKEESPKEKTPEESGEEQNNEDRYDEAEGHEYKTRNRRERRLMQKLESEKESSSFLAGKLEAMTGAKASTEDADYLKGIERIYGTESPEALMATELLTKAIVGARDDAEERAFNRFTESQQKEEQAVKSAESELDTILDDIEDTYGVELNEQQEAKYFELMKKMSPKGSNGEVTTLADAHAVWEVFSERTARNSDKSKVKQLADRSLTGSGTTEKSNLADDSNQRFLKENGII